MATQFCERCKQVHPGRACDYDDKGECAQTVDADETKKAFVEVPRDPKPRSQVNEHNADFTPTVVGQAQPQKVEPKLGVPGRRSL